MRLVENSEAATEAERAALGEMRRQLREWERARRALRDEPGAGEPGPELTYSREDARAEVRARRRRRAPPPAAPAPAPPPPPSPPPSPPAPAAPQPRTRSRGTVHINLWTLDEAAEGGARRRALRNGTLDSWLAGAPDRQNNK